MFRWLRNWRRERIIEAAAWDATAWRDVVAALPVLTGLDEAELDRLRELCALFLHAKALEPVAELELDERMRLAIAALACLPILNLDLDYYRGFHAVVVYPGGFRARHQHWDESGTVHEIEQELAGEAWEQGPLIVSWEDIERAPELDGFNVVIHECAHKLDMLIAGSNGLPPLQRDMRIQDWSKAFTEAFADLERRVEAGQETAIDPYAAESPAEFFAVTSEAFFEIPHVLRRAYPAVYAQLALFYRQDPAARLPETD